MEYKTTSIKEVIGRVIRNTRVPDSSFIVDMPEWIAEALGMMKTRFRFITMYKDLDMNYHIQKLPNGLVKVMAVVKDGYRLRSNASGCMPLPNTFTRSAYSMTALVSTIDHPDVVPEVTRIDDTNPVNIDGTFIPFMDLPFCDNWYFTELDHLHTSFPSGRVRLYYKSIPVDEEGYPLIIDNEHYKSAIYFYVRGMMGGAGYPDKQFSIAQCEQHFLFHKDEARREINALTVDRKEEMVEKLTRLIIPTGYMSDML